jgi:nifR3 family TIM-barrel protein
MDFWNTIERPIIGLSPMDGVTDASFRYITAKYGRPDVTFTEFVNIQAAFYSPHTLFRDFTYCEIERPLVAQIYGRLPELFYKVAHIVCELGFDGLDINMGCPARKVAATGCGAALIRTPHTARVIIRSAKQGIRDWANGQTLKAIGIEREVIDQIRIANRLRNSAARDRREIPLSVKTRLGYDRVAVEEWIPTLLDEQPAVISLHGRTLQQGYKGHADWDAISRARELADNSPTLILGNGDIQNLPEVYRRVRDSKVDGVLLGRAVQGNPWIFRNTKQVKEALRSTTRSQAIFDIQPIELNERFRIILEHSRYLESLPDSHNFVSIRKHLTRYCRGFRGAAELRSQMLQVKNAADVLACVESFMINPPGKAFQSEPSLNRSELSSSISLGFSSSLNWHEADSCFHIPTAT